MCEAQAAPSTVCCSNIFLIKTMFGNVCEAKFKPSAHTHNTWSVVAVVRVVRTQTH